MAFKMISMALFLLCFSLRSHDCRTVPETTRRFHTEKELKIERKLMQNTEKSAVKFIQVEEGDIIDCVDIYRQPSLDHPLLKNHKVQMRPSVLPPDRKRKNSFDIENKPITDSEESSGWSRQESCPDGTVPIYRTTEDEITRAQNLTHQMLHNTNFGTNSPAFNGKNLKAFLKLNKAGNVRYHGAVGTSSVYNLKLGADQTSTVNIWVENGPPQQTTHLLAGWMVSPAINGDSSPRLFVMWSSDGDRKIGCFNFGCNGFVQVHPRIAPRSPLRPVSIIGGKTYEMKFQIAQDQITGNWWLIIMEQNTNIGYWPKEIVPDLSDGGTLVGWGGMAIAGASGVSPPMGSGLYPDGFYDHAAYFRNIHYLNKSLEQGAPKDDDTNVEVVVDSSVCYQLQNDKTTTSDYWGYRFAFGGPGGPTCKQ